MSVIGAIDALHLTGLVVALVLGSIIGFERQYRRHPGGLHTTALVALGSAGFMIASVLVAADPTSPARVAGQVVTGVGFLCAGVIMHHGMTVRGINTAATIWCSSAVGVLAGLGQISWATAVALLVVLANVILHVVEHALFGPADKSVSRRME